MKITSLSEIKERRRVSLKNGEYVTWPGSRQLGCVTGSPSIYCNIGLAGKREECVSSLKGLKGTSRPSDHTLTFL